MPSESPNAKNHIEGSENETSTCRPTIHEKSNGFMRVVCPDADVVNQASANREWLNSWVCDRKRRHPR
jgi:hypothetical protein